MGNRKKVIKITNASSQLVEKIKVRTFRLKKLSIAEQKAIGKILITEFVGDLREEEINFLTKLNSNFKKYYEEKLPYTQVLFENIRDDIMLKVFPYSENKLEEVKKILFDDIEVDKRPTGEYKRYVVPFLYPTASLYLERFKNSKICDRDVMIAQLKLIHEKSCLDVHTYLGLQKKSSFKDLTVSEKKFANVSSQEEYNNYLMWDMFRLGYEKCYDEEDVSSSWLFEGDVKEHYIKDRTKIMGDIFNKHVRSR